MISEKFKIHDTCGVNNLHGMPGILAGIIGAIVVGLADEDDYGYRYKGSFTPSDYITVTVTDITLRGKMGMQPILPVTVPVKKIKGASRQCSVYCDGDEVLWCK